MTPIPFNETQRLAALESFRLADKAADPDLDRLTRLASRQFEVPIALVSLVEEADQHFLSRFGTSLRGTPREIAFCAHAIMDQSVMVVTDAATDTRFARNPLVTGKTAVRFYAGAPLVADGGFRIGTFCLLDRRPRPDFGAAARVALSDFAGLTMSVLSAYRDRDQLAQLEERGRREADAQQEVLAYLAHEIRSPLSAMVGLAEVIERRALGGEISARYQDYAGKIREAGTHLVDVAGKTLNLQRLKSGDLALEEHDVVLSELLERAVSAVEVLAQDAGIRLERDGLALAARGRAIVRVDPTLIIQMLINLLSNAIKYTRSGGEVRLTARAAPEGAIDLCVCDSGIGMDDAGVARALLPFGRVSGDPGRAAEGYGLGLPITKQLVELHGGGLIIHSQPGRGTSATLRLPAYRLVAGLLPAGEASPRQHVA